MAAVPKPPRKPKAARRWNSTIGVSARTKDAPKKQSVKKEKTTQRGRGKPRKVNSKSAKRKREKLRAYGPVERSAWIAQQPCIARCGRTPCQNAHVETGGMGYKAGYEKIVPLCFEHHHNLHAKGVNWFQAFYRISLSGWAEITEQRWQAHLGKEEAVA